MKIIFQLLLVLLIGYNVFHWYAIIQSENKNNRVEKEVVFVDCNATKASKIQIEHNFKRLTIVIPSGICKRISEGDKINLIYNRSLDHYHYPGSGSLRNLSIFFLVIFGLSSINFEKLRTR